MSNIENPVVESADIVAPVEQETPIVDTTNESTETNTQVDTPVVETKQLTQDEFNKVYFEKKQAERELEALKAQLAQKTSSTQKPDAPAELVKPTLEQFEYDEDAYREALIDYKVEVKLAQKQQAERETQQQTAAKTQAETTAQTFNDKCIEFEKVNPAYTAALNNHQATQFVNNVYASNQHIAQAVLESDVGAQLDFHLLTNPQDAERLSKLSPMNALKEIGKLEMKYTGAVKSVDAPVVPKGKVISDAPAPIAPVNGSARSSNDNWKYDPNISMEDYSKRDAEERKAKAKR